MSTLLPHPDPMPVREALRVLRHGLRRGRKVLRDTVPVEALPGPAAQIAGTVLHGLDSLADEVDHATTQVARRLLSESAASLAPLHDLGTGREAEAAFAQVMYAALRASLRRLGDPDAFISEALLRRAYAGAIEADPDRHHHHPAEAAADMALRMLDPPVVRDVAPDAGARCPHPGPVPLAVFAALLWLMSDRSEEDSDEALTSATDLALALAAEIGPAVSSRDRARLADLFAHFASHV